MKICSYCTTQNRDAAIFCTHCKHPLPASQTRKAAWLRNPLLWLLVIAVLIGLISYLLSSRSFLNATVTSTPLSNASNGVGPAPTRTRQPVTLSACVTEMTRIRRRPNTQSETIGGLPSWACLTILGRNEEGSWVYVVSDDHQTGWVSVSVLPESGDISRVSIREETAMANPARPTLTGAELANGAQAYLTQVSATNIAGSPLSQYVTACFESAKRIGDMISCRMERAYCDYLPEVEGIPTFCNDRPYPDQNFALVVFGQDWSDYDGQCIIVSGYLQINRGILQIEALDRDQISSCD